SENTAAQLENLVTNSTGAIQRVQGELAAVSNCLRNRQAESASVASQAEIAVQRSQSALQAQTTLSVVMTDVASLTSTDIDVPLSNIQTAAALLTALQSDLAAVETPTRITDVLQRYLEQQSELQTLQSETSALEIQLDNILDGLMIESGAPTCRG
ncbi:hypothetical protein BaRGS_00021368, partial [Batillaria attramentaria]